MKQTAHDPSPLTTIAIALGAMKGTDVLKDILRGQGFGNIPDAAKSVSATTIAIAVASLVETSWQRRLVTGAAAAGLASLIHNSERLRRGQGDAIRQQIMRAATVGKTRGVN